MPISKQTERDLPKIRHCLAQHPVERAWLFGSCSRGEERVDSDVDFLVEYTPIEGLSLKHVARLFKSFMTVRNRF